MPVELLDIMHQCTEEYKHLSDKYFPSLVVVTQQSAWKNGKRKVITNVKSFVLT